MTFALRPILAIACFLAACSRGPTTDPLPYTEQAAIVAGQAEAGFEAVGALTYFRGGRYFGTFCTGTLIAPQWVLTSASCLDHVEVLLANAGETFEPSLIQFFVGQDSGSAGSPPVDQSGFYDIAQVHSHPNWDPNDVVATNNIALLHLTRAVDNAEPLTLQRSHAEPSTL